jgi:hypothetical protein
MKSLKLKTTCHNEHVLTTLGNIRQASVQIRQINNIPDGVPTTDVIRLFSGTADITYLGGKPGRMEFDFSDLGIGRIIRE